MVSELETVNIHDFDFVDELSTELVCGICQFAVKDPMQNADCGHRFCAVCFEDFKEHSRKNSKELLCPMDRGVINSNNVFRDKAAERFILNQMVYCLNNTNGCIWSGELRHHQNHITRCNNKKHRDIGHLLETIERQKALLSDKEKELATCEKARENLMEKIGHLLKTTEEQEEGLNSSEKIRVTNEALIDHLKRTICDLSETVERQRVFMSIQNQEILHTKKIEQRKEATINHLNKKISGMMEQIELISKDTAVQTKRKGRKRMFSTCREYPIENNKLLKKSNIANESILDVKERERRSRERELIMMVLLVVAGIFAYLGSEELAFITIIIFLALLFMQLM